MEPKSNRPPLICIVGETASGKTALAIELAQQFNGEIIAADARTIYRGLDIGTAKPTPEEQALVAHHLIDIVALGQMYTVADFKRDAEAAIDDITRRSKIAIVVGGSGLYVNSLIYNFAFRGEPNREERQRLQDLSVNNLQQLVKERGLPMPTNAKNPRHLIGVLETGTLLSGPHKLRENTLLIAPATSREILALRIHDRTLKMLRDGLQQEVRGLVETYGWEQDILGRCIGYMEFRPYFNGDASIDDVMHAIEMHTRQLAKRQRTWFKRNKSIHYIRKKDEAVDLVTTFLNNLSVAN